MRLDLEKDDMEEKERNLEKDIIMEVERDLRKTHQSLPKGSRKIH